MTTENKQDKDEDIAVVEEKDGSVTVQLPDSIESPDAQEERADSSDDGSDDDHPDDTDAIREARRNRRRAKKDYIKRTNEEKDVKLQLLERQNRELMDRLSVVERKTHGADLARFEKAIEDEEYRFQYAQRKMQEATDNSDGAAFTKAQELWYDSRRKLEAMQNYTRIQLKDHPTALPTRRSLGEWDTLLGEPFFYRLNRSLIIQIDRLRTTEWNPRSQTQLTFDGAAEPLPIGRHAAARLKEILVQRERK